MKLIFAATMLACNAAPMACAKAPNQAERARVPSFDGISDSLLSGAGDLVCLTEPLMVRVGEPPSSRNTLADACSTTHVSPTTYVYKVDDKAVAIVGVEYEVVLEAVAAFADSLSDVLTLQHGRPTQCPSVVDLGPHVVRHTYWYGSDYSLMLLAKEFEPHPSVGIEIHAGVPGCSHWAGRPYER